MTPCKLLEWDSDFFGVKIARIEEPRLSAESLNQALQWCSENKIDCLYFLCAPDDDESVRAAENVGFHLVDVRVELFCRIPDQTFKTAPSVRHFRESDLPSLKKIAADSYTETRFYYDRNFTRERVSALYQEWLRKSCSGDADAVLVAMNEDEIGGFITCQLESSGMGRVGLVGVKGSARGIGLGDALVKAALNYFSQQKMAGARVITQGRNIAAQRLYQTNGFLTSSMSLWYHKWFGDLRRTGN
jgi:dTDP-4-amino-4,6-dideoxy-D-galactose acyltransferase